MPSTYSSRLRLELIGAGEQVGTWNDTTNRNLGTLIETSVAGYRSIAMPDSNYTLTVSNGLDDEARYAMLNFTGTLTATREVIVPAVSKLYVVKNQTNQTLNVKTSGGSARAVATGKTVMMFIDGTNSFDVTNDVGTLSVGSFSTAAATITGGTVNSTAIGAVTPSTGAFTNLSYTGTLSGGTGVINIGSGQLYKDATGNVGIGIVPSSFNAASTKALQVLTGALSSNSASAYLTSNINRTSTGDRYIISTYASSVEFNNAGAGGVQIRVANSGTAGDVITFTQPFEVTIAGNTLLGGCTDGAARQRIEVGSQTYIQEGLNAGSAVYRVLANGNVQNTNNSYGAISDIKFKENIADAPSYLERFMQVRFVNFNFKQETGYQIHKQLGVIAQEFERQFPSLVVDVPDLDENGQPTGTYTKSVIYSVLNLIQGKIIQEQQFQIQNLSQRIEALEAR